MGNWAVNVEAHDAHPYVRQCGVVTVVYNYFGNSTFRRIARQFTKVALVRDLWNVNDVFEHSLAGGVPEHKHMPDL